MWDRQTGKTGLRAKADFKSFVFQFPTSSRLGNACEEVYSHSRREKKLTRRLFRAAEEVFSPDESENRTTKMRVMRSALVKGVLK